MFAIIYFTLSSLKITSQEDEIYKEKKYKKKYTTTWIVYGQKWCTYIVT